MGDDILADQKPLTSVRVLLAEDDRDTREMYEYVLTRLGATVTSVSRAANAVAFLDAADVVVTDESMPDKDGVWLLEQIRAKASRVPVIGISGYTREQNVRLTEASFDILLLKPIDPWELATQIVDVLRRKPLRKIGGGSGASPSTLFFDLGIARKACSDKVACVEMLAAGAETRRAAIEIRARALQARTRAASLGRQRRISVRH